LISIFRDRKAFIDVAPDLGLNLEGNNGATFSDLNNDGFEDIIIPGHYTTTRIYFNNNGKTYVSFAAFYTPG
jgi:hypothetical protein